MFRRLRKQWKDVTQVKPGKRFQNRYEQRKKDRPSALWTPLYIVVGSALIVLGLTMLVAPGPGLIVLFIGAALIGQESLIAARALDQLEVQLRRAMGAALRMWQRASVAAKAAVVIALASALAGAGWGTYAFFSG